LGGGRKVGAKANRKCNCKSKKWAFISAPVVTFLCLIGLTVQFPYCDETFWVPNMDNVSPSQFLCISLDQWVWVTAWFVSPCSFCPENTGSLLQWVQLWGPFLWEWHSSSLLGSVPWDTN
jgi:hypothetical protein